MIENHVWTARPRPSGHAHNMLFVQERDSRLDESKAFLLIPSKSLDKQDHGEKTIAQM